ncbi:MAG: phosphoadenosine phosphosulfate reductase family protein [Candidatus Hodarchaeota archaeon]
MLINKYDGNFVLLFTGDKVSTVILDLCKELNMPVIFVDTGLYQEEVYEYLKLAEQYWCFRAEILKDERVVEESTAFGKEKCFNLLKEKIVLPYLENHGVPSLIEPIKFGKETAEKEGIMSVFPLSNFSGPETWLYIREKDLPYLELYNKGYKKCRL